MAPPDSLLSAALIEWGVKVLPLVTIDAQGRRLAQTDVRQQIKSAIATVQPDLVHANSLAMGRLAGPVTAAARIPSIAHIRDIVGLSAQAITDLNEQTRLLAVSHATRDFHIAQGIAKETIFTLYNGVDLDRFSPRPAHGWLHAELGLAPHAVLLGTIGQIVLRKGHDVLAEAASLVAERMPDVHFVIVGNRYSQKLEAREHEAAVRRRFAEEALAGRGHFLEFRTDVPELLNELTLLVHPARQEPLGQCCSKRQPRACRSWLPMSAALAKSSHPTRPNSSRPATPRRWRRPSSDLSRMSRCAAKKPPPPGSESANSFAHAVPPAHCDNTMTTFSQRPNRRPCVTDPIIAR